MVRKRPCRVCRKWFQPERRAGKRQRVCSNKECQRERHRRACKRWHKNNPDYDRGDRLRRKLRKADESDQAEAFESEYLGQLDWKAARDAVGLQVCVIIDETSKDLIQGMRDAVASQLTERIEEPAKHTLSGPRDEMEFR